MTASERPVPRPAGRTQAARHAGDGLWRSAYLSHATEPITRAMLDDILQGARVFNACAGVTGLLMHGGGSFMQHLEGPRDGVEAVMRRIRDDPRHTDLVVIFDEPADDRLFAGWWLAGDAEFEGVGDIEDFARRMRNLRDAAVDPTHRDEAIRLFSLFWHDRHDAGPDGGASAGDEASAGLVVDGPETVSPPLPDSAPAAASSSARATGAASAPASTTRA